MKREHFYRTLIALLLLLNVGVIVFIFLAANKLSGGKKEHLRPDEMIIMRLQLDERQQHMFDLLKHEHHQQMLQAQEISGRLHEQLFHDLKNGLLMKETEKDSIYSLLAQNQVYKEKATFDHLQKLRGILRPSQEAAFDKLVTDISERIMSHHPPGPPPGNGRP